MDVVVENLTKSFGYQKAVDSVSFEVKKGEILGCLLYTSPSPRDS